MAPSISPETNLLRTVARVELGPAERELFGELLSGALDWKQLCNLASWHGLEPLLLLHLGQHSAMAPPEIMQSLRGYCNMVAGRNLLLGSKLISLSKHLRSRQVEHIAYKGPLLAQSYYGSCGLRISGDLDIVVPTSKISIAQDALREIGFIDKNGFSASQQAAAFRFGFEYPFTDSAGLDVDLHWRLVPEFISPSLDMDAIWRRVTTARLFDCEIPTFCPEDLMIALCLHSGQHEWVQLSHYCDIERLLHAHPRMDWDVFCRHLADSNTKRIVYVCLYLLNQHWHPQLPEDLMAKVLSDPHVARLAERIQTEMWSYPESMMMRSDLPWLLDRSAGEEVMDRFRFLAGMTLNPTQVDYETFHLPESLMPLYPGLRALRLAYKYTTSSLWPEHG